MGKSKTRTSIRWLTFRDSKGKTWVVDITSSDIDHNSLTSEQGEPYSGCTLLEEHRIVLDAGSPRSEQDYILLHELSHVACNDNVLRKELKAIQTGDKAEDAEEAVIRAVSASLYKILRQFGLQWPERPKTARALERATRKKIKK